MRSRGMPNMALNDVAIQSALAFRLLIVLYFPFRQTTPLPKPDPLVALPSCALRR
jgi:hypothetical protein